MARFSLIALVMRVAERAPALMRMIENAPVVHRFLNRLLINMFASSTVARPHRFSLWSPSLPQTPAPEPVAPSQPVSAPNQTPWQVVGYTSWPSLVDRSFTGRHLPPLDTSAAAVQPPSAAVLALFDRGPKMLPDPRSSLLFCFFAQWLTDSFLRTHPSDLRRNTSNHEIDLCQIYGLDEQTSRALRTGQGGRLKSRTTPTGDYPELLFANGELNGQFYDKDPTKEIGLAYLRGGRHQAWRDAIDKAIPNVPVTTNPARRDSLHAVGLDRGNSTIVYAALNAVFLREHNRIAGLLAAAEKGWDDDRLFETARLITLRQALQIVVDDYIRHIGGLFPIALHRGFAEGKRWYRTNRITMEFNLLYRWHSLAPDVFTVAGAPLPHQDYRFNNAILERQGVETVLDAASTQPAGRVGLFNTPGFLAPAEAAGLAWARKFGLRSFNAYREQFGMARYESIDALAKGDGKVAAELKKVYGDDVDAVEFTVGLLAEGRGPREVMPDTLQTMVAYDAFTHIFTNPILADEVHCEATFSRTGLKIIEDGVSLAQLVERNRGTNAPCKVSLSCA